MTNGWHIPAMCWNQWVLNQCWYTCIFRLSQNMLLSAFEHYSIDSVKPLRNCKLKIEAIIGQKILKIMAVVWKPASRFQRCQFKWIELLTRKNKWLREEGGRSRDLCREPADERGRHWWVWEGLGEVTWHLPPIGRPCWPEGWALYSYQSFIWLI